MKYSSLEQDMNVVDDPALSRGPGLDDQEIQDQSTSAYQLTGILQMHLAPFFPKESSWAKGVMVRICKATTVSVTSQSGESAQAAGADCLKNICSCLLLSPLLITPHPGRASSHGRTGLLTKLKFFFHMFTGDSEYSSFTFLPHLEFQNYPLV